MKNLANLFCLIIFLSFINTAFAQQKDNAQLRHPIYDLSETNMANVDTIPNYVLKQDQIKITGTIYKSDGVTPANDIILYIEQADEDGSFDLRKSDEKQYNYYRSWVKTNADGKYTLYTFIPGYDRTYNQLQEIFPVIKEPSQQEYAIGTFLFDKDPLLTRRCRRQIEKHSDLSRILKLKKQEDGSLIAQHNIVLPSANETAK